MRLSFCEPVWATPTSRTHIRQVDGELKLGGGVTSAALCGFDLARGWDLRGEVTSDRIRGGVGAETNPTCVKCGQIALLLLDEAKP